MAPYCTVRRRMQVGLLRSLRGRLEYEARVWPDRFSPTSSPLEVVFESLIDAHGDLEALLAIDRQVIAELDVRQVCFDQASDDVLHLQVQQIDQPVKGLAVIVQCLEQAHFTQVFQ